ncbi:MAG: hypothetical protein HY335_00425 [Deinococcus sp.]|nr:hypothetical protein [Deinococcus sp.]
MDRLPKTAVVDLDDTVFCTRERERMAKGPDGQLHWATFMRPEYVASDTPNLAVIAEVGKLARAGYTVVYLSGRDDSVRQVTEEALRRHGLPQGKVVLKRNHQVLEPDLEWKLARLYELARDHDLVVGVGDRETDWQAYAALGIAVWKVKDGQIVERSAVILEDNNA